MLSKKPKLLAPKLFKIIIYLGMLCCVNSTFAAEPKTKIGLPVKLNHFLPTIDTIQRNIGEFKISKDGKWVVYVVEDRLQIPKRDALYAVNINGGTPIRVDHATALSGIGIRDFEISPDSSRVIYISHVGREYGGDGVYSFSLLTGNRIKLFNTQNNDDARFLIDTATKFSADSTHVLINVYKNRITKVYSVPVTGGSVKLLTGVVGKSSGHVVGNNFVFTADNEVSHYSVSIKNGGTPRLLFNPELLLDPTNVEEIFSSYIADIHPNGLHGLIKVRDGAQRQDFYSFPISGGRPIKLISFPSDEFSNSDINYLFSSNNKVYFAVKDESYGTKIYSISMANGSSSILADMPNLYASWRSFISDDNSYIVMSMSDNRYGYDQQIYSISTSNGNISRLSNNPLGKEFLHITQDSEEVIYALNDSKQGKYSSQLFRVNINGQNPPRFFGSEMTNSNRILRIRESNSKMSKDGSRIIFCANVGSGDVDKLYHLIINKDQNIRGDQEKLTPDTVRLYGNSCGNYQINSASTHVVFLAKSPTNRVELFSQRVAPNDIVIAPIISLLLDDE